MNHMARVAAKITQELFTVFDIDSVIDRRFRSFATRAQPRVDGTSTRTDRT